MKILIAIDGSDYSKAAVEECCGMVIRPETADVLIVSAFEDTYAITAEPFAISAEYYQKFADGLNELARGFVETAERMIRDRFPNDQLTISTDVLRGSPDQQIIEKAKEWNADLIVVGSHGHGFGEGSLGRCRMGLCIVRRVRYWLFGNESMLNSKLILVLRRSFIVWLIIISAEIVHGIARVSILERLIGDFRARQISVFIGSIIIAAITFIFVRWLQGSTVGQFILIGAMWVTLTIGFEILLGRLVMGLSWERITSDYDIASGGLMVLGLIVMLFAPLTMARLEDEI